MGRQSTLKKSAVGASAKPEIVRGAAVPDLDRLIHERLRLGIVSALAANESPTFNDLKKLLKQNDLKEDAHLKTGDLVYVPQNSISKIARFITRPTVSMYMNSSQF